MLIRVHCYLALRMYSVTGLLFISELEFQVTLTLCDCMSSVSGFPGGPGLSVRRKQDSIHFNVCHDFWPLKNINSNNQQNKTTHEHLYILSHQSISILDMIHVRPFRSPTLVMLPQRYSQKWVLILKYLMFFLELASAYQTRLYW